MNAILGKTEVFSWAKISDGANVPGIYTFGEIFQLLAMLRGDMHIPTDIRQFCDISPKFQARVGSLSRENVDAILVEPNAPIDIEYGPYCLNRSMLITHIINPIRAANPDPEAARVTSAWFHKGVMTINEEVRRQTSEKMLRWMPEDMPMAELAADVLRNARGLKHLPDEGLGKLRTMTDDLPLGVVIYSFQYLPDGRPASWPPEFRGQVEGAARDLGLPLFEPVKLIEENGVANALEADLRHYRKDFLPTVGNALADFAIELRQSASAAVA